MQFSNYIGGEFVPADDGAVLNHVNPSTGEVASTLPDSDVMDVVSAIQSANKALQTLAKTPMENRPALLMRIADEIAKRKSEFAAAYARDLGVPIASFEKYSFERAVEEFRHHAKLVEAGVETAAPRSAGQAFSQHRLPIGIVAIITPASDPLVQMASRVAPALAAGNAVIVKPSRFTPETAELFARAIHAAGVPPGLFAVLQGRGEQVGTTLTKHPGISTIAFVGSTEIGKVVQATAAEMLKRTHLALGSRNPVIVFAGVDIAQTVSQVVEACLGQHPSFAARGSRLFIQESIYKEFLSALKTEIEAVKIGDPLDPSTNLGPLAANKYFTNYQAINELAAKQNGRLLMGGVGQPEGLNRGYFVKPTVIFDLTNCSTLQQEEIVGPFINATSFKYQHDALKHANTSPYGQAAYIFENDLEKQLRVAAKLEVGNVYLNSGNPHLDLRNESEGLKGSGQGRIGGSELLDFFSRRVSVSFPGASADQN